jgi:hypothetical protein
MRDNQNWTARTGGRKEGSKNRSVRTRQQEENCGRARIGQPGTGWKNRIASTGRQDRLAGQDRDRTSRTGQLEQGTDGGQDSQDNGNQDRRD